MAQKSPTPILIDTNVLSTLVGEVLLASGAPYAKKSTCLNRVAAYLAGQKHNWGYLTGLSAPFVAQALMGSYVVEKVAAAPSTIPAFVIEGAHAALEKAAMQSVDLDERGAPVLAKFYLDAVPLALHVFTTADEICNDIVHNRPKLVEMVANEMLHLWARENAGDDPSVQIVDADPEEVIARVTRAFEKAYHASGTEWDVHAPGLKSASDSNASPSQESWDKVGRIMRSTDLALEEFRFIAKNHAILALAHQGRMPTFVYDLIEYIEAYPGLSRRFTSYMRDNEEAVQMSLDNGSTVPSAWQDAARLTTLLDDTVNEGAPAGLDEQRQIFKTFLDEHLGQHADPLKIHIGL